MNLTNIIFLFVLLSAFAIGINVTDSNVVEVDAALNNASNTLQNISLEYSGDINYMQSFFVIIERGVQFLGAIFVESLRFGIHFGMDNPRYFTPEFIIGVMKLLVAAILISLLIKPLFYLGVVIVLFISWLYENLKKRKKDGFGRQDS